MPNAKSNKKRLYFVREEKPGLKPMETEVARSESSDMYHFRRELFGPRGGVVFQEHISFSKTELDLILAAIQKDKEETVAVN